MPMLLRGALIVLFTKVRGPLLIVLLASLLVMVVQVVAQANPMVATYYANKYAGKPTASVSYGGKNVIVTVNDRMPLESESDLDLSWAAAQALGLTEMGTATVDASVVQAQPVLSSP
jgi:hypothetical protein